MTEDAIEIIENKRYIDYINKLNKWFILNFTDLNFSLYLYLNHTLWCKYNKNFVDNLWDNKYVFNVKILKKKMKLKLLYNKMK